MKILNNLVPVLFILQAPALIFLCIKNRANAKKRDRKASGFVWMTLALWVLPLLLGIILFIPILHLTRDGYWEILLAVALGVCGGIAAYRLTKRCKTGEEHLAAILAKSLQREHFTNGQSFRQADFDSWILANRKAARVALPCYLGAILAGGALSLFFSNAVGGVFGNVMALLCVFAGLLVGGALMKRMGREATYYATKVLHISKAEIAAARERMKRGTVAWRAPSNAEPMAQEEA